MVRFDWPVPVMVPMVIESVQVREMVESRPRLTSVGVRLLLTSSVPVYVIMVSAVAAILLLDEIVAKVPLP